MSFISLNSTGSRDNATYINDVSIFSMPKVNEKLMNG